MEPFQSIRFDNTLLKDLPARCLRNRAMLLQALSLAQRMGQKTFGMFAGLNQALATEAEPKFVEFIQDIFINRVDLELQKLYQDFFQKQPWPQGFTHEQRIDMLDAVKDQAYTLVAQEDWQNLALWLGNISHQDLLWRLSDFATPIRSVTLRMSYHCNFECAHCYNESGPKRKHESLDMDAMLAVIHAMPSLHLDTLFLTGGEPFLRLDHVETLVKAARKARIKKIGINTNAFWAQNAPQMNDTLDKLEAAGFGAEQGDFIKASAGIFHQKFMELEVILKLAQAFKQRFNRPLCVDYEIQEEAPPPDVLLESARLIIRRPSSLGRNIGLPPVNPDITLTCRTKSQIVFDPDGSIRPCCGLNYKNQGLKVAEMARHDLAHTLKRIKNDAIFQAILKKTMPELAKTLEHPIPGRMKPCEACHSVFGSMADREPALHHFFSEQRYYPFEFNIIDF